MKEPAQSIKVGHPGVGSFGHLAEVLIFPATWREGHPGTLSRRRTGSRRSVGGASGLKPDIGRGRRAFCHGRQAQGLRRRRPQALRRPAGTEDLRRTRLQEARYRLLAHAAGAGRHAASDHRQAQRRAARRARRPQSAKDPMPTAAWTNTRPTRKRPRRPPHCSNRRSRCGAR